jgi:serine/threonine protein kinase
MIAPPPCIYGEIAARATEQPWPHPDLLSQVHRDMKPGNILLNSRGEVKISDFGLSAELDSTKEMCATFIGTHAYMSPERLGGKPYSFASDIWSLGITLVECALGQFPYTAYTGSNYFVVGAQRLGTKCPVPFRPLPHAYP